LAWSCTSLEPFYEYGISDLILFASAGWTVSAFESRLFIFGVFEDNRWLWKALARFILPPAVTFTRFANPRWVFIFGI